MDQAKIVFVGTVIGLGNSRRWATVTVEEVWGGDVPQQVEVRAGPRNPPGPTNVATTVDRTFEKGTRYLFVPYRRSKAAFLDNICTPTREFRPALERFRPPGVQPFSAAPPISEPVAEDSNVPAVLAATLAVTAFLSAIFLSVRTR